jgi:hypothetical protein
MTGRRVARSVLGLLVGFTLATAAIGLGRLFHRGSLNGERLGALDVMRYCEKTYGSRSSAVSVRPDALGWRCGAAPNGLYASYEIDMNNACQVLYHTPAHAQSYDTSFAYSWECFRGKH